MLNFKFLSNSFATLNSMYFISSNFVSYFAIIYIPCIKSIILYSNSKYFFQIWLNNYFVDIFNEITEGGNVSKEEVISKIVEEVNAGALDNYSEEEIIDLITTFYNEFTDEEITEEQVQELYDQFSNMTEEKLQEWLANYKNNREESNEESNDDELTL